MAAGRHTVQITGSDFQNGAAVDLGPDVTIRAVTWLGSFRLDVEIDVADAALPGPRRLTVTNPDFGTADMAEALRVVRSPDLNGNCAPDGPEFIAITRSFNTTRGDPDFAEAADLDGDDAVGPADLSLFLMYIGRWFPTCF